jgi:hypothetical protein
MLGSKKQLLLIKAESSYGVDPSPVAANAIQCFDLKMSRVDEIVPRRTVMPYMSNMAPLLGKQYRELSFKSYLDGSGTQGARVAALFDACGLNQSSAVGYTQWDPLAISAAFPSVTAYRYIGDIGGASAALEKLTGCRVNLNIVAEVGELLVLEWTLRGIYQVATSATFVSPTFGTLSPLTVRGCTITVGGSAAQPLKSVKFGLNNEVALRPDMTATYGIQGFEIMACKPGGTLDPEETSAIFPTTEAAMDARTQQALSVQVGSAANGFLIYAPKIVFTELGEGDRDGIYAHEIAFDCSPSSASANDDFYFRVLNST